jgi:hypothetical protein
MVERVNPLQYSPQFGDVQRNARESRPFALLLAVKIAMARNSADDFQAGVIRSFFVNLNDKKAPIDGRTRAEIVRELRRFVAHDLQAHGTHRNKLLALIEREEREQEPRVTFFSRFFRSVSRPQ